jgi:hypothetical protein
LCSEGTDKYVWEQLREVLLKVAASGNLPVDFYSEGNSLKEEFEAMTRTKATGDADSAPQ